MATVRTTQSIFSSLLRRSFSSSSAVSLFRPLRPLSAASFRFASSNFPPRCFSTRPTNSSLNDPSPNWSNRPPKETILLDGCDFEHWLVVMEKPEGDPLRNEIIDSYIKTLAMVVGSEEEAKRKIYSVSTRHYFAFGALVSEELSYKIKELPRVRWVLPDSYLDVRNKDYGGEPFIDGEAVPYDPKYHEEWVRNNARANERNRRNDRPRNFDRSRNYERRRENSQNQNFQNTRAPPMSNPGLQNTHTTNMPGGPPPTGPNYTGGPPQHPSNNYTGGPPPHQQQHSYGGHQLPPQQQHSYGGHPPPPQQQHSYGGHPPPHQQQQSYGGHPPPHQQQHGYGGHPPPHQQQQSYGGHPPPHQQQYGAPLNYQNDYEGGMPGAKPY